MGVPVLVMGHSGSGKSASLRNFAKGEVVVLNVAGKPLPFRSRLDVATTTSYSAIKKCLQRNAFKAYAIDDAQYLMGFEEMDTKLTGFEKYNAIGYNFVGLVRSVQTLTSPDTIVYFLMHTEQGEDGRTKAKTIGKLIDSHYTLEGLFTIVLMCEADNGKYRFVTNSDGTSTCKSPMGMFDELEIDNDLKAVDETIRAYYFEED